MKITKFVALAGAALLATAGAFAQATQDYGLPQGFSFWNKIGSDVVKVTGNAHKEDKDTNWRSEFAGIYDQIHVAFASEKIAFSLEPKFGIKDVNENYYDGAADSSKTGHGNSFDLGARLKETYLNTNIPAGANADAAGALNSDDLAWNYWGLDWGFRFTPFDIVDFLLSEGDSIKGSKLYARDANWGAQDLGSDGFAIITKPIDGLKISGAIPFGFSISSSPNYMDAEVEDEWVVANGNVGYPRTGTYSGHYRFRVDLGAEYTLSSGLVSAGVKINDVINAGYRQYGIYAGLNMGALSATLGYNFAENNVSFLDVFDDGLINIRGRQAVAGSVQFVAGDLTVAADAMYNMSKKQSIYDAYAGAKVAYALVPGKFNVDMLVGVALDLGTNAHHGTEEDDRDLTEAMASINGNFIDLYYAHTYLEDTRAALNAKGELNEGVAASQNWQYYTALKRQMSNGNMDTTSAAKAALALKLKPGFTYTTGNNVFDVHVNFVNFFDGDGSYQISFPVSWQWNF
ncbi:MAG: hypothetical protein IJU95_02225 [Treponema sp.]|nr:hypothetical protein [Treponema sp.]